MSNKKQTANKAVNPKNAQQNEKKQTAASAENSKNSISTKSGFGESRFLDNALKNISDPTLAADARVKLAKSSSIDSMCRVIERDQKMSTDEKLERLQTVNNIEKENKEQAHRIAAEFTWQDGVIAFCISALIFGLGWLGGSAHPRLPKSAT